MNCNYPEGEWVIKVDGVPYTGAISAIDTQPLNCGVAIWTLKTWEKFIGSAQIEISAPRTRFRKVKPQYREVRKGSS